VQQRILHNIADICEHPAEKIIIGIDGCGVPVHAMPLSVFAHGIAKLAKPELLGDRRHIIERIAAAMNAYPEMMSGTGRGCAAVLRAAQGKLFLKSGADGYYMCGIRGEGIGISLKLINYGPNISVMVLIETLKQLGMLSKEQLSHLTPAFYDMEIRNSRNDIVGVVKPQFALKKTS
jgi:L-asparaginase II